MFQDSFKQWQAIYEDFWGKFEFGSLQPWMPAFNAKNFEIPQLSMHTNFLELYFENAKQIQEMAFAPFFASKDQNAGNPLQLALDWQRQWLNLWLEFGDQATSAEPQPAKAQNTVRKAAPKKVAVAQQTNIAETAVAANEQRASFTKDDLKQISGIGPGLEKKLNDKGIVSLQQIAALSKKEIAKLETEVVRFPGRIERDDWVGQAKRLSQV